jgi:hypothetical protein
VAAVIDSNAEISAHPFIISFFSLADNTGKKTTNSTAYRMEHPGGIWGLRWRI